jgi:hypothetical protein
MLYDYYVLIFIDINILLIYLSNGDNIQGLLVALLYIEAYYRVKRFFSRIYACVVGADALKNWINDRRKNRLILIILQCQSFPYLVIFHRYPHHYDVTTAFQRCKSRSNYIHTKSNSGRQMFIEFWTDQKQIGTNALVKSKGT